MQVLQVGLVLGAIFAIVLCLFETIPAPSFPERFVAVRNLGGLSAPLNWPEEFGWRQLRGKAVVGPS